MTRRRQQAWRLQDVAGETRQQRAWKMQDTVGSLPGIGQVYRATSHPKRIIWMVIVLVSLFQTVRQSTEIITQYLQ
ncbi:hypothetical protein E2C01_075441 [Portunus trituberculatus]|uniref:Uncharacterized protein n=1 Tax=Portunus trituberculatus TaxID=210409 RepID=A0A5B7IJ58_PORTR|nr:hypothetical protein [Portunus trituberculatus]